MTGYSFDDHIHRFAIWIACRAAQRGCRGFTIGACWHAIEQTGIQEFVNSERSLPDPECFDRAHKSWCKKFVAAMKSNHVDCSIGRAAKVMNMYLKTYQLSAVAKCNHDTSFWHPPIDAKLLKALKEKKFADRTDWNCVRWTKIEEYETYHQLIVRMRGELGAESLWTIEQYWDPRK